MAYYDALDELRNRLQSAQQSARELMTPVVDELTTGVRLRTNLVEIRRRLKVLYAQRLDICAEIHNGRVIELVNAPPR